jgi:uncharacterized OsmC-like protein
MPLGGRRRGYVDRRPMLRWRCSSVTVHGDRMNEFPVVCASGTFRTGPGDRTVHFDHQWSVSGVDVEMSFNGAHLLHAAVAGCVLNDVYREAKDMNVTVHGVRVSAQGGFTDTWASTGINYTVELDSPAEPIELQQLLAKIDSVAEIPRAIRQAVPVRRTS